MKRIIAMTGVIILVLLYILTLFTAVFDSSLNMGFFWASVAATILIPIFMWVMIKYYDFKHRDEKALDKIMEKETSSHNKKAGE